MDALEKIALSAELIGQKMRITGPYISAYIRTDDWISPWDQDGLVVGRRGRRRPQYGRSNGPGARPINSAEQLRLDALEPLTTSPRFQPIPYDYVEPWTSELAQSNAENVVRWHHWGLLRQGKEVGSLVVAHFTVLGETSNNIGYFAFHDQVGVVEVLST